MKTFLVVFVSLFVLFLILSKLSKSGSFLNRFSTPFTWLFSAVILSVILLPIGFIWDVGKSIKELKGKKILKAFWNLIKEFLLVLAWIAERLAVGIDIIGNVIAGEFLEDIITSKEDTLFRKSGITISASTGHLEKNGWLNKTGRWFTKKLSSVFEPNHSIIAYEDWLHDSQRESDKMKIHINDSNMKSKARRSNLGGLGGVKGDKR